jgi:hypothetical protein
LVKANKQHEEELEERAAFSNRLLEKLVTGIIRKALATRRAS